MKDFCLRKVLNCEFGNEIFKAANQHEKSSSPIHQRFAEIAAWFAVKNSVKCPFLVVRSLQKPVWSVPIMVCSQQIVACKKCLVVRSIHRGVCRFLMSVCSLDIFISKFTVKNFSQTKFFHIMIYNFSSTVLF